MLNPARSKFIYSLVCFALFTIVVYLGIWQMHRAKEKELLIQQLENKLNAPKQDLSELSSAPTRFTAVTLSGIYMANKTFLLDNQVLNGQVGFRVITPMRINQYLDNYHDYQLILIDRGWIQRQTSRNHLPSIPTPTNTVTLSGIINHIPSGFVLKKEQIQTTPTWPIIIQSVDYELISHQLQQPIYNFVVQINDEDASSFTFIPTKFGTSREKHLGYAIQWFIMAVITGIYYVLLLRRWRNG